YHEGDAGIALFERPELAVMGAVAVKEAIDNLEPETLNGEGQVKLKIRQGLATGLVFTAVVGDSYRRIPVIDGKALDKSYQMESDADPDGYVHVDDQTQFLTDHLFKYENGELTERPTFDIKTTIDTKELPIQDIEKQIAFLERKKETLLAYFPPFTRDEVQGKRTGKNETATILFTKMPTLEFLADVFSHDEDRLAEAYNAHFLVLRELIEMEHHGEIDKLYSGKVIARFRQKNHQEDAKKAALRLPKLLGKNEVIKGMLHWAGIEADVPVSGYTPGLVYIGPVGSNNRRAFTMLGGKVNLAARIMAAAKKHHHGILTDVARGNKYACEEELKGIGKVKLYTPPEESLTVMLKRKRLIGRDAERAHLASIISSYYKSEKTKLVNIISDAGFGKTELTKEFETQFKEQGGRIYRAGTAEQAKDIPGYLLQDFVKNTLGITTETTKEEIRTKLDTLPEETRKIIHHWLGLSLGYEKPAQTGKELEQARRQTLLDIIDDTPKLLVFNDVHWADENSLAVVEWLSQNLRNAIITTNYRPKEISRELAGTKIQLGAFGTDGIKQHIEYLIKKTPDKTALTFIEEQTQGNPLYIEEIVHFLQEEKLLQDGKLTRTPQEITQILEQTGEGLTTIEKLVLQRYRNLRDAEKQTILDYAACMFGEEFPKHLLEKALGRQAGELDNILEALQKADFLRLNNGKVAYKHNLTKKAVYERCTTMDERVKRHTKIGDARKVLYGEGDDQIVALAWDYENGEDLEKKLKYNYLASKMFVEGNIDDAALFHAKRNLKVVDELDSDESKKYHCLALHVMSLALQRLDRVEEAKKTLEEAFNYASKISDKDEILIKLHANRGRLRRFIQKNNEAALEDFKKAAELARKINDKNLEVIMLTNVSTCQEGAERINTVTEAIKIMEQFGNSYTLAIAYNNLSQFLRSEKRYQEAESAGNKGLEVSESIKNHEIKARTLFGIALIAEEQGLYELANKRLQEAEKTAKKIKSVDILSLIYEGWMMCAESRKDNDLALEICDKWLELPISEQTKQKVEKRKKEFLRSSS
ncbi:tetratricopeptide repeat protein, partial [Candidatus Woesearchaeota archaeon]|nr:tetratricopeptide repeat protein [Candidatus Woesearchaeota archaeon]